MRVVTWNLWHGGGRRIPQILDRLLSYDADVLVLTEYRHGGKPSAAIAAGLAEAGYHMLTALPAPKRNSIQIACRSPLEEAPLGLDVPDVSVRVRTVRTPELTITGVYTPQPPQDPNFFESFTEFLCDVPIDRHLVIGDWNAGLNFVDEDHNALTGHRYIQGLWDSGWHEAWRTLYPERREFTWYHNQSDNGFRIDQAFVTRDLLPHLRDARYDHEARTTNASDHSALIVDFQF